MQRQRGAFGVACVGDPSDDFLLNDAWPNMTSDLCSYVCRYFSFYLCCVMYFVVIPCVMYLFILFVMYVLCMFSLSLFAFTNDVN